MLPGSLDASKCTCSGEGLGHATAGHPTSFRIHTLDLYGNTRTQGGDSFTVTAQLQGATGSGSESIQGMVEDLGQGIYRAAYTATAAGSYDVSVTSSDGRLGFLEDIVMPDGLSLALTPDLAGLLLPPCCWLTYWGA